ncbi:MAG TPA: signal peptidase I [Polyangiaceae bacterium]|nr:signal peptidase I [Polyangiaceae bacterium]
MRGLLRALVWLALALALVVGVARAFAIRWWRVPADDAQLEASIAPTLRGGDLVILWRLTEPDVGDLVLCPEPARDDTEVGRIVIGRIVAETGDEVEVKDGRIFINNGPLLTESGCPESTFRVYNPDTDLEVEQHCAIERIGATLHKIGKRGSRVSAPPDQPAVEVNRGEVWLASDNRVLPYDSRDYGSVSRAECTETVVFRLVSEDGYFDVDARFTMID